MQAKIMQNTALITTGLKKVLETTYVVRPLTLVVTLDSESQKL